MTEQSWSEWYSHVINKHSENTEEEFEKCKYVKREKKGRYNTITETERYAAHISGLME